MNTLKIKEKTNHLIGYHNFLREEEKRVKKLKKITFVFATLSIFLAGTFTVNALTDNKIVDTVKEVFTPKIKVNGEEKNATCEKKENGIIKCTMDKEVLGGSAEVEIEYDEKEEGQVEFSIDTQ